MPNPWRRDYRPLTIAHRGHSIAYPENTLAAYEKAIELGVEMIECDVNMTRDGVLVMMHDWKLDRTTTGTGRVSDHTWDEISALDAGVKFDRKFASAKVPTTEETLLLYRGAGILACFEVKGEDEADSIRIASALIDLLVKHNALDFALVSGYNHPSLALAKTRAPELELAPERLPDNLPADPPEAVRQAQALGSRILQHQYTVINQAVMEALHGADIAVWDWTVNSEESLAAGIELGADGLMGDDVVTMMKVLDRMRPKA